MHTKSQKQILTLKNLLIATSLTMTGFCGTTHASSQDELPEGFDATAYVGRYHDLSAAYNKQHDTDLFTFAKNHFLMSGRHEGREARSCISLGLPADFKEDDYLILHPDIATHVSAQGLNPIHFAISHFLSEGKKEGRAYKITTHDAPSQSIVSLPDDFDPQIYLILNNDVLEHAVKSGFNPLDFAKEHYLTNGRKENRSYTLSSDKSPLSLHTSQVSSLEENLQQMRREQEESDQVFRKSQPISFISHPKPILPSSDLSPVYIPYSRNQQQSSSVPSTSPSVPFAGMPIPHPVYQGPSGPMQNSFTITYQPLMPFFPLNPYKAEGSPPHELNPFMPAPQVPVPSPMKTRNLEAELNAALDQGNEALVLQLTREMAEFEMRSSPKPKALLPEVMPPIQDDSLEAKIQRAMEANDEQTLFRLLNANDDAHAPKPSLVRDMAKAFEAQGRGGNADQNQFMRGYEFDHGGRFVNGNQRDPSKMNNQHK
ncbi:MAG: hypothetical protein H2057_05640 [Alphaproteobacteria bacterium]|nr:hypothetical protein [Alphaproteobacteria bacterium]